MDVFKMDDMTNQTDTHRTYLVQHPNMSEPLEIDSTPHRTPRMLAAWASMWVLRNYDIMLPVDEFTVVEK